MIFKQHSYGKRRHQIHSLLFGHRADGHYCEHNTEAMKAKELQPGQQFKQKGQRKWRTVIKVVDCDIIRGRPVEHKGKLLIVLDDCRQWVIDPETELIIK